MRQKLERTNMKLGKLISSEDGKCKGPCYGVVYTAPEGGKGYIAGHRNRTVPNAAILIAERFAKLSDAQDFAVRSTDY
jgi:hypothetical protein